MAESLPSSGSDKKSYNTRGRKRSLERQEKDQLPKCVAVEKEEINSKSESEENLIPDCAICLQTCIHPARLPCGHIFCFLCVKGVVHSSWRCAMCRSQIPHDYLDAPQLLTVPKQASTGLDRKAVESNTEEEYQWFYEGRHGGWWQFEERTASELESAVNSGLTEFDTLICGSLYTLDLNRMIQFKKERPWQSRKLLRELPSKVIRKGIAGIK